MRISLRGLHGYGLGDELVKGQESKSPFNFSTGVVAGGPPPGMGGKGVPFVKNDAFAFNTGPVPDVDGGKSIFQMPTNAVMQDVQAAGAKAMTVAKKFPVGLAGILLIGGTFGYFLLNSKNLGRLRSNKKGR